MATWNGLMLVAGIALLLIVGSIIASSYREKKLIKLGILPEIEKTTDEDIHRLINEGYPVWAIKRYRQIHNVSLKEAKESLKI